MCCHEPREGRNCRLLRHPLGWARDAVWDEEVPQVRVNDRGAPSMRRSPFLRSCPACPLGRFPVPSASSPPARAESNRARHRRCGHRGDTAPALPLPPLRSFNRAASTARTTPSRALTSAASSRSPAESPPTPSTARATRRGHFAPVNRPTELTLFPSPSLPSKPYSLRARSQPARTVQRG